MSFRSVGARAWLVGAGLVAACSSKPPLTPSLEHSSGSQRQAAPAEDDPLQITGLRGMLSQEEIRGALEPRLPKFARCLSRRSETVEWLSGSMVLSFLVHVDGSVASVFPRDSSVGDRESERCALDVAAATRFPRPRGGEAEFTWSFDMPLDDAIREPVAWSADDVPDALAQLLPTLGSCSASGVTVTAYVDTSGAVASAGAASPDAEQAARLDCVAQAVQQFSFPSPGSYAAKLTFKLP